MIRYEQQITRPFFLKQNDTLYLTALVKKQQTTKIEQGLSG